MQESNLSRKKFLELSALGAGTLMLPAELSSQPDAKVGDREVVTTCNQCFLGCGLIAHVREERIIHLRGNPESPTNQGRICPKAHAGVHKVYHPERVGYPLLRVGKRGAGKWRRISWEEALERISKTLGATIERYGERSVAVWQNVDHDRPDIFKRFVYALGSPNYFDHIGSAGVGLGAGLMMGPILMTPDYANAECILMVGVNPLGTKELCRSAREVMKAKEQGASMIVADPRMSETAMHASKGLWLPIRPGTDGILLAGFANYLIRTGKYDKDFIEKHTFGFAKVKRYLEDFTVEKVCKKTDIPRAQFMKAVESMAGKRTVVEAGSGMSFQPDGGYDGVIRIILAALLGGIDRPGGLLPLPFPRVSYPEVDPQVPQPTSTRFDEGNFGRIPLPVLPQPKHISFMGISQDLPERILAEDPYPLKAMFICSTNPVYTLPNSEKMIKAFDNMELVVTIDAFMSETSVYADMVLPGSVYLENMELNDAFTPFRGAVMRKPVVKPAMESRSSQDIIIQIARKMGLTREFPFENYEQFLRKQLEKSPLDFDKLHKKGFQDLGYKPGDYLKKDNGLPSGKIELYSSVLAFSGMEPLPRFKKWKYFLHNEAYPLHLISYRLPYHANSRTAANPYLNAIMSENHLLINTATAQKLGLESGQTIWLESKNKKIQVPVLLTEGLHPETVALSYHFGHRAYSKHCIAKGVNFNEIAEKETDPISYGLAYNSTRVRIKKL